MIHLHFHQRLIDCYMLHKHCDRQHEEMKKDLAVGLTHLLYSRFEHASQAGWAMTNTQSVRKYLTYICELIFVSALGIPKGKTQYFEH